jgi:hypothetical protein
MAEHSVEPAVSMVMLVREAVGDTRALLRTELALAVDEAQHQLAAARHGAIAMAITAVTATVGLSLLLVALALTTSAGPLTALILGVVLLGLASLAGIFGYRALPRKPLERTQERLQKDVRLLRYPSHGAEPTPSLPSTTPKPAASGDSRPS